MQRSFLCFIIFILATNCQAQPLSLEYAKQIGGPGLNWAYDMTQDATGNIFLTGEFELTCDFDTGPGTQNVTASGTKDMYITKLTPAGDLDWVKTVGNVGAQVAGAKIQMDVSSSFFYVIGSFIGTVDFDPGPGTALLSATGFNVFICKYAANGNLIWANSFVGMGAANECPYIEVDSTGNFYMTGSFMATVDFDPGPGTYNLTSVTIRDMFIAKFDTGGNLAWAKQIGDTTSINNGITVKNIALDASNNIYTVGTFSGNLDFNPGPGVFNLSGNFNGFILKSDAAGNFLWAKQIGGIDRDTISAIAVDLLGNIYVTGHFKGTSDFDPGPNSFNLTTPSTWIMNVFVAKYNNSGGLIWAKHFENQALEHSLSYSIALDQSNNVAIGFRYDNFLDADPGPGIYMLQEPGDYDIGFLKLSQAGTFIWAGTVGGQGFDYPFSIFFGNSGSFSSAGTFNQGSGLNDFDPGPGNFNLTGFSQRSVYILKMNQCNTSSSTISASACDYYISPSGNFIWSTSGIYSDTLLNSTGCDSILTINLSVNSTPIGSITGNTIMCQGNSTNINISFTGIPPFTYTYSNGTTQFGPFTTFNSSQNILVTPLSNTTYTLISVDDANCTGNVSGTAQITINPLPVPVITGDSTLCPGQTVILNPGAGYTNYLWSTGAATQSITASTLNIFTVTVTDANGCTGSDSFTTTAASPYPTVLSASGSLGICLGDSVQLFAQTPMSSYQWYKYNVPIAAATSNSLWVTNSGRYKCISTDSFSCLAESNQLRVSVVCFPPPPPIDRVGENEILALEILVFPNPNNGAFSIAFNRKIDEPFEITVFDFSGKRIMNSSAEYQLPVNLTLNEPGYYLLEIIFADGIKFRKPVVVY